MYTSKEFYSKSKEIQHAFIYGWALGILHSVKDSIDPEANAYIDSVSDVDDKGGFIVKYAWTKGIISKGYSDADTGHNTVDESESVTEEDSIWISSYEKLDEYAVALWNALEENVKFNDEYNPNDQ